MSEIPFPESLFFLASTRISSQLTRHDKDEIMTHIEDQMYEQGHVVFRQGEEAQEGMYLVVDG